MSDEIEQLVDERRSALGAPPRSQRGIWGLALSGGGIRSATFCFGLLRGLAAERLLLRFDLLSTVSGGGYIGAMLGRLLQRAGGPGDVRDIVDRLHEANPRWFAWWLRANGRYLVPRGTRDNAFAAAVYLRNMVAVHVELGVLGLLLGAALCLLDLTVWWLLAWQAGRYPDATLSWIRQWPDWLPAWLPTPWLVLPLLAWGAGVLACAFWSLPWVGARPAAALRATATPRGGPVGRWFGRCTSALRGWLAGGGGALMCRSLLVLLALVALIVGRDSAIGPPTGGAEVVRKWLWVLAMVTLLAWLPALALARRWARTAAERPSARNMLTEALATLARVGVAVVLIGVLDRFAWFIAFEGFDLPTFAAGTAVAAGVLRSVLPLFSTPKRKASGPGVLLRLGGALGYLATFLLLACWVALAQHVALGSLLVDAANGTVSRGASRHVLDFCAAVVAWSWIAAPVLIYAAFGGFNVGFMNQSSLHGFYRARLVRSYLGAANPARFGLGAPLGATTTMPDAVEGTAAQAAVTRVQPDDDLPFADYAPQRHGGPVHLIGVCLNETEDPRGHLYNQDRRGRALTLAPGGRLRVGLQDWERMQPERALSLGSWMAISGAAVSPGLGAMTRGGLSALAMFGGLRLGYWWDSAACKGRQAGPRRPWSKLAGLVRETVGNFDGPAGRDWFLTDGGHFENTGAYALLAEEAELIVLADCGADPDYVFDDLENLVRKARIDLQAEVRFQKPRGDAATLLPVSPATRELLGQFGSLGELASNTSLACFALAEVRYRRGADEGKRERIGHLILVKPNLCAGLPVDLFNFKAKQPDFPQQSTADQFFDEAQWESYFQLGNVLGARLNEQAIDMLLAQAGTLFVRDDGTPVAQTEPAPAVDGAVAGPKAASVAGAAAALAKPSAEAIRRIPERIAAGAVTATLSLGAVATVGVSAWQTIDALRTSSSQRAKDERAALKELTDLWAPAAKAAPNSEALQTTAQTAALAATLARLSDTLCPAGDDRWFVDSALARDILHDALERCGDGAQARAEPACRWLRRDTDEMAPTSGANCLMRGAARISEETSKPCLRYWGYDYGLHAELRCMHPDSNEKALKEEHARQTGEAFERDRAALAANAPAVTVASTARTTGAPAPAAVPAPAPVSAASASVPVPAAASAPASVTTSSPAVSAAASPSRPSIGAEAEPVCKGRTIYVQVYGNESRDAVREQFRAPWQALGASVPLIEDVLSTARSRGTRAPLKVERTTVRYHDIGSLDCAKRLAAAAGETDWRVEPLSSALKPSRNVIEVWVAPKP